MPDGVVPTAGPLGRAGAGVSGFVAPAAGAVPVGEAGAVDGTGEVDGMGEVGDGDVAAAFGSSGMGRSDGAGDTVDGTVDGMGTSAWGCEICV